MGGKEGTKDTKGISPLIFQQGNKKPVFGLQGGGPMCGK